VAELQHRRVINGKTADGKWGVLQDGEASAREKFEIEGATFEVLHFWNVPTLSLDATDHTQATRLTDLFTLAPGSSRMFIESMGHTAAPTNWHRTNTIDYEYIISGRIDLMMEDGTSVTLEAGDVNVQLGGMHQWWNHYEEPCVFAVVMVGVPSDEEAGVPEAPSAD
jgi:hypothetical protein